MAVHRRRSRLKVGMAVAAVAVVAAGIGIGTADAGTHKPWQGGGRHTPKPTASTTSAAPSPTVKPSPTTASPTPTKATSAPTKTPTQAPTATPSATPAKPASTGTWTPPPANGTFDYQIGGAYTPPAGVSVVSRDRTSNVAAGLYNICYVNAFQAQPDDNSWWKANHPELLLKDASGNLVIDKDWNEILLDFSTAAKRAALTTVVGEWIDGCATKGFQAVEPDNLDSYTRSKGLLTESQAIAYAASLTAYAHGKGLAVGQKNTADLSTANAKQAGFDFAVAEECADFDECENYTATYGNNVIVIEYTQSEFTKACSAFGSKLSIVLRDVDVTTPGSGSYVFKSC
ncbi:endo alpha-1,4 polygalactosaminidase [Winogradskya humida]|uniref:Glycoside-hydrolase family GH114 TIM-barrel domain-containing protein n=1 Tax=Winogradskya humida TaxID=113566 RepID=A0ABQ4A2E7_9ACTN|nr:hypothetical protein Ahu01nite_081280 [Actinoplanes humidus]